MATPLARRKLGVQGLPVESSRHIGIDSSADVQRGTLGRTPEFERPAQGPRVDAAFGIDGKRGQLPGKVDKTPECWNG